MSATLRVLWGWLDENSRWHPNETVPLTPKEQHAENVANGYHYAPAPGALDAPTRVLGYVHIDGQRFLPRDVFRPWAEQYATREQRAQWRPVGWL